MSTSNPCDKSNGYRVILSNKRRFCKEGTLQENCDLDHASIIYSTAFRRLQKKAQVFSLEDNAAVHSRLTHSLEVAEVGWQIASKIAKKLCDKNALGYENALAPDFVVPFARFVETACLMHDLGNPPFGHLGEYAIRQWFTDFGNCYEIKSGKLEKYEQKSSLTDILGFRDFLQFDGNAQGIRLITRLQNLCPFEQCGLNLTYTQILSLIKYPRSTCENNDKYKKPGYFQTEKDLIDTAHKELGRTTGTRFPLSYLMEAADDIAYCMSDIEDGIEKGIISVRDLAEYLKEKDCSECECFLPQVSRFVAQFEYRKYIIALLRSCENDQIEVQKNSVDYWEQSNDEVKEKRKEFDRLLLRSDPSTESNNVSFCYCERELFKVFKIEVTDYLIDYAIKQYIDKHNEYYNGTAASIFTKNTNNGKENHFLHLLKSFSREKLYCREEAEKNELAGYSIIHSLLNHFKPLLLCSCEDFDALAYGKREHIEQQHLDIEKRLFHKLPESYVCAYKHCVEADSSSSDDSRWKQEWIYRAHLIVDFIAGMTDDFALKIYRELSGMTIE